MPTPAQRLIYAVRTRNYDRLRELLQAPDAHSVRSAAGRTALHAAAEEGDVTAAEMILNSGADVNARTEDGRTPLHLVAGFGGPWDLMDSDHDRRDPCRRHRHQPWSDAITREIAQIAKEKNPRIPRDLGLTDEIPEEAKFDLFFGLWDCLGSPAELLKELTVRGIQVDNVDPDFAEFARGRPRYLRMAQLLLDAGAEINARDDSAQTPLQPAVELGTPEMVELLLSRGAAFNASKYDQDSSLVETALDYGKTAIADILLRHGANLPNPVHLHIAASNGRKEVVAWLLEHGVDINQLNETGDTATMAAAQNGHHEIVTSLLERGADFRTQNHQQEGLLLAAARWSRCLEAVLPLGLPLDVQNTDGSTALHAAAQSGDWASVQMLLRAGASPNKQDNAGNTPLHVIFISEEPRPDAEFPTFHCLVVGGANRSIQNNEGKTSFDWAVDWNYPDEYLKLLDPSATQETPPLIWLGVEPYLDFLPRALVPVQIDGCEWPSCEHYFHAQKVSAPEIRECIRTAPTVIDVFGRLRDSKSKAPFDWTQRCDAIMRSSLLAKFQQHPRLKTMLLTTGDAILVSDSHCDSYWSENRYAAFNAIGKMLASIRAELRASNEPVA